MSTIVQIPGGTATLRDELVSERQYALIEVAGSSASPALSKLEAARGEGFDQLSDEEQTTRLSSVQLSIDELLSLKAMEGAAIVAFLERWSLERSLPTIHTVDDLDRPIFRALASAVMPRFLGVVKTMGHADFSVGNPRAEAYEERPTGASKSSEQLLEADAPSDPSIPTPPSGSASTDFVG